MQKFSIVSRDDERSLLKAKEIQKKLFKGGMGFTDKDPDLVCVIGGDGTFLGAVHKYAQRLDKVAFVGINTGTFGFFTDYDIEETDLFVNDILTVQPQIEERRLLKITARGQETRNYLAVNEMRVENILHTQSIDVSIDGSHLETFRGTGLCVCTQTGSTAYNRSLNGAVIESGLEVMELSEVIGLHHSRYRSLGSPLIINGSRVIRLEADFEESTLLCFDRYAVNLKNVSSVECTLADQKVRMAHYRNTDYIERLYHLF